jgi:hypothetical protein
MSSKEYIHIASQNSAVKISLLFHRHGLVLIGHVLTLYLAEGDGFSQRPHILDSLTL